MAADIDGVRRALEAHLAAWLEQLLIRSVVECGSTPPRVDVRAQFHTREEVYYHVLVGAPAEWDAFEALLETAGAVGVHPFRLDVAPPGPGDRRPGIEIAMRAPIPEDVRHLARF
ncbi:MAG: hypothetical protein ACP5UD_08340 [Conexivisphaera sp.]